MLVFGELPAVLCAINLVLDYVFGTAAVVRNLSAYFALLFTGKSLPTNRPCGDFKLDAAGAIEYSNGVPKLVGTCNEFQYAPLHPSFFARNGVIDYIALIAACFVGCACAYSSKIFENENVILQVLHIGLVLVTILAAFSNRNTQSSNFHPFVPNQEYDYAAHQQAIGGQPAPVIVSGAANIFFVCACRTAIRMLSR